MSKKARVLAAIFGILAVGMIVWAVTSVPETPVIHEDKGPKVMTYENNTISEEKNGHKVWEITSEKMDVDVKTQDMKMEVISGHFYAEDGSVADIKADSGVYGGKSKDMKLKGNIKVTNSDGSILTCDEMAWKNKAEILEAIGNVRAVREDVLITADRVESSDGFNKVKAMGHAHVERNEEKARELAKDMSMEQSGGKSDEQN